MAGQVLGKDKMNGSSPLVSTKRKFNMTHRPVKFKLDAYRLYIEGHHPTVAFEKAGMLNGGCKLSGCMTTRAYAPSYMSDDIKGYIRRQIARGNDEVISYFNKWGLDLDF